MSNLIIENTTIVTMNASRAVLRNASIAVAREKISAIGASAELRQACPDARVIDGSGKVVLPGFINSHTHISMSLQKGLTLAIPDGLYRVMWPVEKALTEEDAYIGALIGGAEALLNGATSIVDHYFFMNRIANATTQLGLRGFLGHTIMSRMGPITGEKELQHGIDFVQNWQGKHPLVTPMLAPHASDTVRPEWFKILRQEADQQDVRLHMHLAQSTREHDYIHETYGMGCVEYMDDLGMLDSKLLAAHCIFIDDLEITRLAQSGANPVYCPMVHATSGRPMEAWKLRERGANLLIGTDSVCNNNVMDITGELRIAGASQKQLNDDSLAMPSLSILESVTVNPAKALGVADQLGTLAPGYLADLILVDMSGLHAAPNYALIDNIVYTCTGRDIALVMVNGQIVVEDGRLLTADEGELVKMAEETGSALIRRAVDNDPELAWIWE